MHRDRCAVELGRQQVRDEVVARIGAPAVDLVEEEALDDQPVLLADLGIAQPELEDALHPLGEVVAAGRVDAEDLGDHARRDLLGVALGGVDLALLDEAAQQLAAQLAGRLPEPLDRLRREERQQEAALGGVIGRIGGDDRTELVAVLVVRRRDRRHGDLGRREALDVMGHAGDEGVRRRQVRAAPPVGVGDRAAAPQVVPDRVRLAHVARVEDVEVVGPIVDRFGARHRVIPPTSVSESPNLPPGGPSAHRTP